MDMLFIPLIHPSRMAAYQPAAFALATAADRALEIGFTPDRNEDLDVHMPAAGVLFYLPGGQQTVLPGGPSVNPASDAIAVQVLSLPQVIADARAHSNPPPAFAPWWVIEGVNQGDFLRFVRSDREREEQQAQAKHYQTVRDFRDALVAGQTSFNVSYKDAVGVDLVDPLVITTLAGRRGEALSVRISTYYAGGTPVQYSTMPPASSLTTIGLLKPALAGHPLVAAAQSDILNGDLTFHVAFQYWAASDPAPPGVAANETDKGSFTPMPAGTIVRLMKVSTADPDIRVEVAAGTLNATGQVELNPGGAATQSLPRASLALSPDEVLAFQVESATAYLTQYQRDGSPRAAASQLGYRTGNAAPWPQIWLTYGLASTTGEPGSLTGLDTHPSTSLGLPSAPIVYNVGIPIFLQIRYARLTCNNARVYATSDERAPKGVLVTIRNLGGIDLGEFRTDEHGQIWGLLTQWDPKDPDIRVIVQYDMEDRPPAGSFYELGLPRITGVAQDADPPARWEVLFDSSWNDPKAPRGAQATFGFAGTFTAASLGTPAGAVVAVGLEQIRVGSIGIGRAPTGDSLYEVGPETSTGGRSGQRLYGEHGGLMDVLKTLRHAHEWWTQLTESLGLAGGANPADPPLKVPWKTLFDGHHRPAPADAGLVVRVIASPDATVRGGASVVGGTDRFQLKLFYPETWREAQPDRPGGQPLATTNLTLLWNRQTVHHELAHVVFLLASELNAPNSAPLAAGIAVYNSAYDPRQIEQDTFTPLLEGVSNVLTLAVASTGRTYSGAQFGTDPAGTIRVFNFNDGRQPPDLLITAGPANGMDARLGLFVPGAIAGAFWDYLRGMAAALQAIPDPAGPDLKTAMASLGNADVRQSFQRLVWLPMRALRSPDGPGVRWDDVGGRAAYPTTYSLIQHLATDPDCYPALSAAEKQRVRDIFGTALNTAWQLWDNWPP